MTVFHKNLELKQTGTIKGRGVYSKTNFAPNQIILEFKGEVIPKSNLNPKNPNVVNYVQIGDELYLGLSGELDDHINHSCNPNTGLKIVGNRALLITLWEIKPGDEITWDYSTTCNETKEEWQMKCACGDYNCRKIISGFQYLDDKTKKFYQEKNVVPQYLIGK